MNPESNHSLNPELAIDGAASVSIFDALEKRKNPENTAEMLGQGMPVELKLVSESQLTGCIDRYRSRVVMVRHFDQDYQIQRGDSYIESQVAIPSLNSEPLAEVLLAPEGVAVEAERIDEADGGTTEMVAFGDQTLVRFVVPEQSYEGLEEANYMTYQRLFALQHDRSLGNLVRITNFVPKILGEMGQGIERQQVQSEPTVERPVRYTHTANFTPYKQGEAVRYVRFNAGRYRAWQDFGPWIDHPVKGHIPYAPAATGIGAKNGPLVIEAWFAKEPVRYLDNDRQDLPYHYSEDAHGKKPPLFSRATWWERSDGIMAVISGTASLLGSDVVYAPYAPIPAGMAEVDMDYRNYMALVNQAYLALDNIEHLLSKSNLAGQGIEGSLNLLDITSARVYVKYPKHVDTLKKIVRAKLPKAAINFVEDDICRDGWLLEIEALAWKEKIKSDR